MSANQLIDLYWLGYLLTGDRERSVQAVMETVEMPGVAGQFFEGWMVTWSRKIFIAKVLGHVAPETSVSQLRTRLRRLQCEAWRGFNRWIGPEAGKPELERALLEIESLPRCALLLSVFEKLPLEDVGILLNVDAQSVKTATAIGQIELARNITKGASIDAVEEVTA
jgi:hypothetical protein